MITYVIKDIKNMFAKQKLLSALLVLNILISCLVICFSCGIYRLYQPKTRGNSEIKSVDIYYNSDKFWTPEFEGKTYYADDIITDISPQMIVMFLRSLSEETAADLTLHTEFYVETPLSRWDAMGIQEEIENIEEMQQQAQTIETYSDDAHQGVWLLSYSLANVDGKIADVYENSPFSAQEYDSGEKVAAVLQTYYYYNELPSGYLLDLKTDDDEYFPVSVGSRLLTDDIDSIVVGGERFKIKYVLPEPEIDIGVQLQIPITALPENAMLHANAFHLDDEGRPIAFRFYFPEDKPCTHSQYDEIKDKLSSTFGDMAVIEPVVIDDSREAAFYNTVVMLAIVISVLAAVNMAILYRYILEKRSGDLAVMRICGCTKRKASAMYLAECTAVNIPLFALTQLAFHKLLLGQLEKIFPEISEGYSFWLYAAVFCIYIAVSLLIMRAMINRLVNSHSLVELKSAHRSTNKLGIMKIFEIIQLAAVLVIMVIMVSAIVSRYEKFEPFEPFLSRKGYMVQMPTANVYPDEINAVLGDTQCLYNEYTNTYDGDTELRGISYCDEYINAYAPPLASGSWLSHCDETYENSGYIPAVVTSCDGRYKAGDTFENEIVMLYDENGEPKETINVKYKIIGVLKDKASVASYFINVGTPKSYRDIYEVFSDSFEDRDWLLTRTEDVVACYGAHAPAYGAMFVFCDDMDEAAFADVKNKISAAWDVDATELTKVYDNSMQYIYEQMYTLLPIAMCIFILTIVSTVSISAIYTKRKLRNYAIFYICGARWRTCALRSLKNSAITCGIASILAAAVLIIGKLTFFENTVINFGLWHIAVCAVVIVLYLLLSMIMPLMIIGSNQPREVLKEE